MIEFFLEQAENGVPKKQIRKDGGFEGIGKRGVDEQALHSRLDKEGVIKLSRDKYDELWLNIRIYISFLLSVQLLTHLGNNHLG